MSAVAASKRLFFTKFGADRLLIDPSIVKLSSSARQDCRQISQLVKSNGNRTFLFDTLALVRRLEAQGIPTKQAEAISAAITEVGHHFSSLQHENEKLRGDIEKIRSELRHEIDKVTASQSADVSILNNKIDQGHHFSSLQHENEKLRGDNEKIHSELRHEIDKVTANQSAEVSIHNNKIDQFLRLLAEENGENPLGKMEQELALSKAVDAMVMGMDSPSVSSGAARKRLSDYERECRERISSHVRQSTSEAAELPSTTVSHISVETFSIKEDAPGGSCSKTHYESVEEITLVNHHRKVAVLYLLLSACLANTSGDNKKRSRLRKGYDARHRVALRLLAAWLDVKWMQMEAIEVIVACSAMALMKAEELKGKETKSPESKWSRWKRGGIIGAAALTGGTLLAITGGLAAPAIAAGFGALAPTLGTLVPVIGASGFAAVAGAAGSVAGSVAVAASFGAAGAGLTGSKMARRIGNVDEFEFRALGENHNKGRLAVGLLVSGFVFEVEDFVRPWEGQVDKLERYALQWESKHLIAVSTAIQDWLTSRIAMELMKQGAMMTVLSTLLVALAWPATLLAATDFIDSKWTIAVDRSDKSGKLLAEVLEKGLQGNRPVTLIGFSLGARVIFKCLQHLAEKEDNAGLVERVVLLGAPISIKDENWESARKIVAGRFVNAYSMSDWTLGVAFRASLLTKGLAGIQPVDIPGIENVDVTEFIEGHSSYLWTTHQIIERLELDSHFPVFGESSPDFQHWKSLEM